MHFAKEMLNIKSQLEELGYNTIVPKDTNSYLETPEIKNDYDLCIANDVVMDHYNKIESSDAILVLNYPNKNINNYIGGAVLMEIGIAYYLGKKIFILNNMPSDEDFSYALEIKLVKPIILNGDLTKIK